MLACLVPNQMRYQAALRPDYLNNYITCALLAIL